MGRIDFNATAEQVSRVTRAFDPRPGAFALLRGTEVKLLSARPVDDGSDDALDEAARSSPPGTVRSVDATGMLVRCGVGAVLFSEVKPSGKPSMSPEAWARGRGVAVGDSFNVVV